LNFENDKNNNKFSRNSEKKRHSISFNKEYFDFFENERYIDLNKFQSNHNPNNKEDLNDAVFTMFLFFLSSFILYILILILVQFLKLILFKEFDILQDLTEIISQYNELTTNPPISSLNPSSTSSNFFSNSLKNPYTDFENFQKSLKFSIF
jgi:hypothetical protein